MNENPRLLRQIMAPNEEHEFHGGRLQILSIDLYENEMLLRWRMAPPPDTDVALPDEVEAAEREIAELPEDEREQKRRMRRHNPFRLLHRFVITDDAGRPHRWTSTSFGGSHGILVGELTIVPVLQEGATALVIDALGVVINIPMVQPQG
jgi:hypothetical protein